MRLVGMQGKDVFMVLAEGFFCKTTHGISHGLGFGVFRHGQNHVNGIALVGVSPSTGKVTLPAFEKLVDLFLPGKDLATVVFQLHVALAADVVQVRLDVSATLAKAGDFHHDLG